MRQRFAHFDLARGLAVLCMFAVHVLHTHGSKTETRKTLFGEIIEFLGGAPAAPTFMFLLGVGIVFAAKPAKEQVLRGLKLLLYGYLLNFARVSLPVLAGVSYPNTPLAGFYMVDILQFAGLSLMILPWVERKSPAWLLFVAALSVAFISPGLWGLTAGQPGLLDLFWGRSSNVFFPFFPWASYPLVGMAFARLLQDKPESWNAISLGVSIMLIVVGVPLEIHQYTREAFSYYHSTPGAVLWMMGFVPVWLAVCRNLLPILERAQLFPFFDFWSQNVTSAYVISWTLIVWSTGLIGYRTLNIFETMISIVLITILTGLSVWLWNRLKKRLMVRPSR